MTGFEVAAVIAEYVKEHAFDGICGRCSRQIATDEPRWEARGVATCITCLPPHRI